MFCKHGGLLEVGEQDIRNLLNGNAFRPIGLSDQNGTGILTIVYNRRESYKPGSELAVDFAPVPTEFGFKSFVGTAISMSRYDRIGLKLI